MSTYHLYIGDPEDPKFHFASEDHYGSIPKILLDVGSIGLTGCVAAQSLIESEKYDGKKLDWGSSGAILSLSMIREFLDDFSEQFPRERLGNALVEELDEKRDYVLFAAEM